MLDKARYGNRTTVPPDTQTHIIHQYTQGQSLQKIGAETHWSRTTIRKVLTANNIPIRPRGNYTQHQPTPNEAQKRCQLYEQGYTIRQVAQICDIAPSTVHYTLVHNGTPRRTPPKKRP